MMVNDGQQWSTMVKDGQRWSTMVNDGQQWSAMVNDGQRWSTESTIANNCQKMVNGILKRGYKTRGMRVGKSRKCKRVIKYKTTSPPWPLATVPVASFYNLLCLPFIYLFLAIISGVYRELRGTQRGSDVWEYPLIDDFSLFLYFCSFSIIIY